MSLAPILAPISLGELIDKITILELKQQHLQAAPALRNVARELQALQTLLSGLELDLDPELVAWLKAANAELWRIEDAIRLKESQHDFGPGFIELARAVYLTNDRRSAIKKEINSRYGSQIVEEKAYQDYSQTTEQP